MFASSWYPSSNIDYFLMQRATTYANMAHLLGVEPAYSYV